MELLEDIGGGGVRGLCSGGLLGQPHPLGQDPETAGRQRPAGLPRWLLLDLRQIWGEVGVQHPGQQPDGPAADA